MIDMSRRYGADPDCVLAGGGNTSCKDAGVTAVKASGYALSSIDEEGFVLMDTEKLRALTQKDYPEGDEVREACALEDMMAARIGGQGDKRPSVECILHALFPMRYVLHVHPALINGLTCGRNGAAAFRTLFGDIAESVLWLPLIKPGYTLGKECAERFANHANAYGQYPSVVFLQNHGIFVAADTAETIDRILSDVVDRISGHIGKKPELTQESAPSGIEKTKQMMENLYGGKALFLRNKEIARFTANRGAFAAIAKPFTPDHIVYCRAYPLFIDSVERAAGAFAEYDKVYGGNPKIVAICGEGVFALGQDAAAAGLAADLFGDAVKIAVYSESFGGPLPLPDDFTDFIVNWEMESYRQKTAERRRQ